MHDLLFLLVGFCVGILGTLIGAGGGFLLTPLFVFLFPQMSPAHLTALSLIAVAANSVSGTTGYVFRKQIHWPSVVTFALFALPGVFLGVFLTSLISRNQFEMVFSIFLVVLGAFVMWRSFRGEVKSQSLSEIWNSKTKWVGGFISFFVGILSSLLGIGGGIVHVPLLSEVLKYPLHIAAGTSHAILAMTSVAAVAEHFRKGDLENLESFVPYLVVGLVIGAQGGAALSKRVPRKIILKLLALALFAVGIRLAMRSIF